MKTTLATVPLSAVIARLDDRFARLPEYQQNITTAYHAVFQVIESGAYPAAIVRTFPRMSAVRKVLRKTASELFRAMGRNGLDVWRGDLRRWLAGLDAGTRERLVNTRTLSK